MIVGNLSLGNHLDYFGTKFRSMDAQVLFRSFRTKIIQSTTATTSIAICVANRLQIKHKSLFCHCENRVAIRGNPFYCKCNKAIQSQHKGA